MVVIIGGGVIGLFCAHYLRQSGHDVTVVDQGDLNHGCSHGNAGMIVPSHFIPLAAPGMISQGIRWMFNSESPFYIKPRVNGNLIKWAWKFYKASTEKRVKAAMPLLRDFSLHSKELYQDLAREKELNFAFKEDGILMLYKTQHVAEEEAATARKAKTLGIVAEILDAKTAQAMEPQLQMDISGAVYYPGDCHLYPDRLLSGLKKMLEEKGVHFKPNTEVKDFKFSTGKLAAVVSQNETIGGDEFIIAGGSWSPLICKKLGITLLLQPGKGYSFFAPSAKPLPKIPSLLLEAKVAVTPMEQNLRFAGTMEVNAINKAINLKRVNGIVKSIPNYYPDYKIDTPKTGQIWSGLRPCSPDGIPYIGRSAHFSNLCLATGHAMMGLSLAPATGHMINALVNKENPQISSPLFSPDRF